MKLTLGKNKRLKSKKAFELLFSEGKSKSVFPLRVVFLANDAEFFDVKVDVKVGVSVPKRRFKLAVHRNKIKRQIKEAYRVNQHKLNPTNKKMMVLFIYNTNEVIDYHQIEKSMLILLDYLNAVLLADNELI